jgi:hypothetical protein
MRKRVLAVLLAGACIATFAGPTPAPVRTEIEALLFRLQASGCQFQRNGSWYGSAEARTHLLRKLDAVEARGTLQSTEQFIALAASRSSFSGKPYRVRCGGADPVESGQWLTSQLAALRNTPVRRP